MGQSAAQQVQVEMVDLLPAIAIAIHQQAIAILRDAFLRGEGARHHEHVADQLLIIRASRHWRSG